MAFASEWRTKEDAAAHGLKIGSIKGIGGILRFESPVSLNATEFSGGCSVGYLTYIGNGSRVSMSDIGRYCAIAPNVEIGPSEHPTDWMSIHPFQYKGTRQFSGFSEYEAISGAARFMKNSGRTTIGHDVWIGDGAFIRRGVKIGDGAIIAARAVVTKDVEPYSIVGGNPARLIRKRFDESVIARFLSVKWWEYNLAPLQGKIDYASPEQALALLEERILAGLPKLQPSTYEVAGGSVLSVRRL